MSLLFKGIYTALVTPFCKAPSTHERSLYTIDWASFKKLLHAQMRSCTSSEQLALEGFVILGSTAEPLSLSWEEKNAILDFVIENTKLTHFKKIVNISEPNTENAIRCIQAWNTKAIDGYMLSPPGYCKPPQLGLVEHFNALADASTHPCLLYNIPSRAGVALDASTIITCSQHPRIRGIKEASGSMHLLDTLLKHCQQPFSVLSGDDPSLFDFFCHQGHGCVSVASHVFADKIFELQHAIDQGNLKKAYAMHQHYQPLFEDLFSVSNPIPIKACLHQMGLCEPWVRRPLVTLSEKEYAFMAKLTSELQNPSQNSISKTRTLG